MFVWVRTWDPYTDGNKEFDGIKARGCRDDFSNRIMEIIT